MINKVKKNLSWDFVNIYKITRISDSQDNILGISFAENNESKNVIKVIEWNFVSDFSNTRRSSKDEVLEQVRSGLNSVNQALGTNYKLSKIYFSPLGSSKNRAYSGLIGILIRHYHNINKFEISIL